MSFPLQKTTRDAKQENWMAINGFPENQGEKQVQNTLQGFNDHNLWAWFSINFLPGVKDIDLLVFHEGIGCFGIEIKAVPIDLIESISPQKVKIRGRPEGHSPQLQAYYAVTDLRSYVGTFKADFPFAVATACWPKISRAVWRQNFSSSPNLLAIADKQIFADDLLTHRAFLERLKIIYSTPPLRSGSNRPYRFYAPHLETLRLVLDFEATKPNLPSVTKFLSIENEQRNLLKKLFPLSERQAVRFAGVPGSGKTFSLLSLALAHGVEGSPVLLLCYNKALAAQLKANIFAIAEERDDPELPSYITVTDIYQHASAQAKAFGIELSYDTEDYDSWINLVIQELSRMPENSIHFPEILLVDEVQDFSNSLLGWVKFWSKNSFWVAIAEGIGQEVYDSEDRTAELADWLAAFNPVKLNKNYRNPGVSITAAFLFSSLLFSDAHTQQLAIEFKQKIASRNIEISRPDELGIELLSYDENNSEALTEVLRDTILDELAHGKTEHEILIISRTQKHNAMCGKLLEAMVRNEEIRGKIDLTDQAQRRVLPTLSSIRLSTIESSRGLEADTVIIVGIEGLRAGQSKDANLGLIALSRSIHKTIILTKIESGRVQRDRLENAIDGARLALGHIA